MPCLLKLQTAATKVYATKHLLSLVSQYQVHDQRLKMLNLSVLIFTWYTCGRILMTADGMGANFDMFRQPCYLVTSKL